ncbi:MAG: hypothetical protein CVU62_09365 [Deltaproteobacteria bacterium HGW-Deltaproteobacteria-2]|jgi:hypothetical protein|nr:MAG: hypothetical protein CVU62_09365 [Deltaproteobacteria bacterium HGW-Deltaproteobacteria-2]
MKKLILALLVLILTGLLAPSFSQATVIVIPSSVNVVRGQSNTVVFTYQFSGYVIGTGTLTSSQGIFFTPDTTIGYNNLPLTVTISGTVGTISETVVIPVNIMEKALQRGTAQFFYRRVFTGMIGTDTATINLTVTGEAGGTLGIRRISVYFGNGRAETTVMKYASDLKAYADIRYNGSGLLKGYWEVDGRLLSYVSQPLPAGQQITLATPDIPALPTFETGTHTLRFVITNPEPGQGIPLPVLVYFVTTDEAAVKQAGLTLKAPAEAAEVPYASLKYEWQLIRAEVYLIQFFEALETKRVFSAYTKKGFYQLPQLVLKKNFEPGKSYYWRITAFDKERRKIGESKTGSFRFSSTAANAGK